MYSNIDLLSFLQNEFQLDHFRAGQEEAIRTLLAGSDSLCLWPTGSGKSLVYQYYARYSQKSALIISPLIALMEDQVFQIKHMGFTARAIHSAMPIAYKKQALSDWTNNRCQFLFVTPERFLIAEFLKALEAVNPGLIVLDEVHCMSLWGHDFRPEYKRLGQHLKSFTQQPLLALTATATTEVIDDLKESFPKRRIEINRLPLLRENIQLRYQFLHGMEDKRKALSQILNTIHEPSLVYASLIRTLKNVQNLYQEFGLSLPLYHGRLARKNRMRSQKNFIEGKNHLLLATNAFGMGIDKSNLRSVIHWELPGSIESYVQEVGRVGRDGQYSLASLFFDPEDLAIQRDFIAGKNPDIDFFERALRMFKDQSFINERQFIKDLSIQEYDPRPEAVLSLLRQFDWIALNEEKDENHYSLKQNISREHLDALKKHLHNKKRNDNNKLQQLKQLFDTPKCLNRQFQSYFGDPVNKDCGQCLHCALKPEAQAMDHKLTAANKDLSEKSIDYFFESKVPVIQDSPFDFQVGDWLSVKARHIGFVQVQKIDHKGKWIEILKSSDMKTMRINPATIQWKKVSSAR